MTEGLKIARRRLPHWRLDHATYFVTWSMTQGVSELSCVERDVVTECLTYFHLERYYLWAYVVMDDHVHAVTTPYRDYDLSRIVHTWKSFTANRINRMRTRSGRIWQVEFYDRIIRNGEDFREKMSYVLTNPARRWPEIKEYKWVGWLKDDFSYK